jgi:hypothetical protein
MRSRCASTCPMNDTRVGQRTSAATDFVSTGIGRADVTTARPNDANSANAGCDADHMTDIGAMPQMLSGVRFTVENFQVRHITISR